MSKLKELIQNLCQDGVEYKKLGELLDYEQPTKYIVESTEYDSSYDIPVLTAGQTFVLGYTNEKFGVYRASQDNPTIIFDDFTTSFHWVDFEFKIKSSAMKMLRPKGTFDGSFKYVYYAMKCIKYEAIDHTRHWISKYSQFEIPVPPLEVQEEIVSILDHFTNLAAELQAELQARKEQYEYYRNKLLTFEKDAEGVKWKRLPDICKNLDRKRKAVTASNRAFGPYPYYGASGIVDYVSSYIFEGNYLLISEDGANLLARSTPIAFSISGKSWVNNHAHVLEFQNMFTQKYIEHYINMIDVSQYVSGGAQPKLNQENLNKIQIPVPSPSEQERIISILDKFETLVNNLSKGLPAEIAAVQEQYEYYRNKLLSFPKVKNCA